MKVDNSMLAILIQHAKDDAIRAGAAIHSVDDLVEYLDENPNGYRKIVHEIQE